jgi:hypothetical protein
MSKLLLAVAFAATLASIAEAQQVPRAAYSRPVLEGTVADLPVWKRITLGSYKSVNALRAALDAARVRIGDSADEILGRPAFLFSKIVVDADLVVVSVAELGFDDSTSLADVHRRAGELGLELCPAEVAPLLRLHYANQPTGEFLNVAMRPIPTYGGELIALSVANGGTGPLLLGGEGRPDLMINGRARFVFVRPARIALPNLPLNGGRAISE